MLEQYREVETVNKSQFTALLNLVEKERIEAEKAKNQPLVDEAKRMLKSWGIANAYSSKCGYKNVSSMFSDLYPRGTPIFLENEIDFIETCLLELKKSNDKKKQEQYRIAELYYKGFDVVDCGCDWSERFVAEDIGVELSISRRTVFNRLNELYSFIVSKVKNLNIIY